jgi:predicted MFS family arabinose efflux permease
MESGEFYATFHVEPEISRFHVKQQCIAALQHGEWRAVISLTRYRDLLQARDVRQIFAASFIGRLPIGVTGLALLLFVQSTLGSFAQGGAAAAFYMAGLAFMAPILGRIIDRRGPRDVLAATAVLFPAALVALVWMMEHVGSAALVLAAAVGATFPPITVCMRTYFRQRLADEQLLSTAYSLESVLIELIFILGPLMVALFVAAASPAMAVYSAAACGCFGAVLFFRSAAVRSWRIEPRETARLLGPLGERGFIALIVVVLCFAAAFGFLEIGVTAYTIERNSPALAGVLLGLMSVGSAMGGLAYGSRSWRMPLAPQFSLLMGLMAVGLALLSVPSHPVAFGVIGFLAGVVMAPVLIVQSMLVAKSVRPEHTAEAFTWSASALLAGVGLGLAGGGLLLETYRSNAAIAGAAASAMLGAVLARVALKSR